MHAHTRDYTHVLARLWWHTTCRDTQITQPSTPDLFVHAQESETNAHPAPAGEIAGLCQHRYPQGKYLKIHARRNEEHLGCGF